MSNRNYTVLGIGLIIVIAVIAFIFMGNNDEEIDNISIRDQNYLYSGTLNPGDYFWTLNIIDEFGNSSGSREGTFQIK